MSPLMILRVSGDQFVQPGDLTSLGGWEVNFENLVRHGEDPVLKKKFICCH